MGEGLDAREDLSPAGLEHPALGVGEASKVSPEETLERLLGGIETGLDLGRRRSQGRGALIEGPRVGRARVAEERLAGGGLRHGAVGREEGLGLARREGVAPDGVRKAPLFPRREGRKGDRHGEAEAPGIEPHLELRREPALEDEPAIDPGLPPAQELPDRQRGKSVLLVEGRDDAGLVHGARGPSGGVRLQQAGLERDAACGLQDDGDLPAALRAPAGQALESIEDLEVAVLPPGHAER